MNVQHAMLGLFAAIGARGRAAIFLPVCHIVLGMVHQGVVCVGPSDGSSVVASKPTHKPISSLIYNIGSIIAGTHATRNMVSGTKLRLSVELHNVRQDMHCVVLCNSQPELIHTSPTILHAQNRAKRCTQKWKLH